MIGSWPSMAVPREFVTFGLLQAALARPRQLQAYDDRADIADIAASYTDAIVGNHPFIDGNKRTGFLVGILFLELNGYRFHAREDAAANAVLALAARTLDEKGFAAFLRENASAA